MLILARFMKTLYFILVLAIMSSTHIQAETSSTATIPNETQKENISEKATNNGEANLAPTSLSWVKRCDTPPGALAKQCRLEQYVVDEVRPNISFLIMVFKTADGKNWIMRVIAPLGLMLPKGLRIALDDQTLEGTYPYMRCGIEGCIVDLMDNDIFNLIRQARSMTLIVWLSVDDVIGVPIPMSDFSKAVESLQ